MEENQVKIWHCVDMERDTDEVTDEYGMGTALSTIEEEEEEA